MFNLHRKRREWQKAGQGMGDLSSGLAIPVQRGVLTTIPTSWSAAAGGARVTKALDLLKNRRLNVDEAARFVNLSSSRLRHLIKQRLGVSPTEFIQTVKLQCAKHLLKTTSLALKEIMWRAGFTPGSHGLRQYKAMYSETPSETRQHSQITESERVRPRGESALPALVPEISSAIGVLSEMPLLP